MTIETLDDLFLHTLKDVLYAERKVLKALPKMERAATDEKLKAAFASHREETEAQVVRLEDVFELLGKPARGAKCDAMVGLIDETEGLMGDIDDDETLDAALIAAAQAPRGSPPPLGPMIFQNKEWLACPPTLFLTALRMGSGTSSSRCNSCSAVLVCNSG